ncbi:DNRLRE domain-containing protein [Sphaerimonospora mesophila]|uniref:DNRLRE domain-containing protein n=1 Tax=Sphaerimonospora mesophila TaxID=37483 RepID=UPI0009FAB46E
MTRDGKLQAARVKSPLTFGGRGTKHLVSAKGEQGTSGLGVTRALPEPKISGNTITYPDAVAPGADLVVIAQGDGFVSQVVFRHKPTGPVTVRLPLTLPKGTTFGKTPQGLPQLKDAKGKAAAAPIVLTAMDAKVEAGPEQGKTSRVDAHVEISGATSELVFTPDAKFLADPTVTYPVTIAAASEWFGGGQPDDAWVNKNDPYSNHAADGWLRAGTTSTSADIARVYLWYDLDAPELEGATVVDADLIIWNYKSGGPNGALCGETLGSGIVAQRVTSYWDTGTLDWNHQPTRAGGTEGLNQAGYNYDASGIWCAKDEALWHQVKTMARAWIEQGVPNEGLVLRAYSETAAINWRQYYSSEYSGGAPYPGYRHPPTLIIEYEPNTITQEVVIPTVRENLSDEGQIPYEEAIANQLNTDPIPPTAPDVTLEQAQAMMEQATDTYEVDPDDLIDLSEEDPPASDETPPSVIDTLPLASATNVSTDQFIQATFDEPVSEVLVTVRDSNGTIVSGESAMAGEEKTVIFIPSQALTENTVYVVEVSGAQDASGNKLNERYTWSFTTGGGVTSPSPTPTESPTEHTVSLPVQVDMWIDNWGSVETDGSTFWAGVYDDDYDSSQAIDRAYLKFDASSLAGKTVTDAKLELWNTEAYGCGNSTSGIKVQRVTAEWSADTLSWDNQPSATANGESLARDPGECSGVAPSGGPTVWSWPITEIVQAWASGQSNYGLLLRGADESASAPEYDRGWEASEAESPTRSPVLKVTYVDSTAPSPAATPSPTPTDGADTTPPTVIDVSPKDGSEDVPPDTQVRVTFSEPVTAAKFSLTEPFTGSDVPGSMSMNATNTVLTFTPSTSLDFIYYAEVTGARDAAGNAIEPFAWSFSIIEWMSAKANSSSIAKTPASVPAVSKVWNRSVIGGNSKIVTSITPQLQAKVSDPLRRPSTFEFEVEHDVREHSQGTGVIWSGSVDNVPSKSTAVAQVPKGKLADGWKVRWHSRAITGGITGPWSRWSSMTIRARATGTTTENPVPKPSKAGVALAPKTFPYHRVDWGSCYKDLLAQVNRARADSTTSFGHTTNPYNWCAAKRYGFPIYLRVVDRKTGQIIREEWRGQVDFTLAARAYTYAGGKKGSNNAETDKPTGKKSRDITFTWRITGVQYKGDLSYFYPMTLRAGITVSSKCQVKDGPQDNGTPGKNSLFTEWMNNAEAEWTIHSPKISGTGKHLLSTCAIVPTLGFMSPRTPFTPGGDVSRDTKIQHPVVRCDTSDLIEKYTGGCALTDVTPVLIFDATKSISIKESAKHVWDAYYHPEWTIPIMNGKKVPGRAPYGVLHRTLEGAVPGLEDPDEAPSGTIAKNRAYSISKCREKWPTVKPKQDELDCDEFPFASTKEGSLSANGNFSARYISHSDNRKSGNQLGLFYQQMRRLGNDPFWVYANPLAADRDVMPPRWP